MDGAVKFNVSANTAQFDSAMGRVGNSAKTTADRVRGAFSGLGTLLAGGAIVSGLTSLLRKMDDISDGARRIGITTTEFQKIGNAAQLVGTSVEAVNKAMIRAGVAASKAARDGGDMVEVFKRANLDPAKFSAAGLEERIKMVAEAQRAANGDAEQMNKLFEAIGVKAAGIDFASLAEEMANVNAASDETVQALARANDELDKAKQNATIFGANLLKGISDASERLGSILGGGTGQTMAEIDAQVARDNAKAALRGRGQLLPDDSVVRNISPAITPAGPVGGGRETILGPNAQENERRIAAEIKAQEELNKTKEQEAKLARETAAAETEQVSKAEEKAKQESDAAQFKQYMLEIDLKIKEAQAAGNKEREAELAMLKNWTEAAIKYEGDFDKAARDVNATLQERNRLREEELSKQQQSIEAELKRAETMAYGTEEAKKQVEWLDEYNKRIGQGATDEQARRFANASTYEQPKQTNASDAGAGGYSPTRGGYSDQSQWTENMRVADLRGKALQQLHDNRASELAKTGNYRSAIRAMDRGQRAYDRAMQSASDRDLASNFQFDGRKAGNMGEAVQSVQDKIGLMAALEKMRNAKGYDPKKGEMENMKNAFNNGAFDEQMNKMAGEQSKTPDERKKEEYLKNQNSNQPEGRTGGMESIAEKILSEIKNRLPIVALG